VDAVEKDMDGKITNSPTVAKRRSLIHIELSKRNGKRYKVGGVGDRYLLKPTLYTPLQSLFAVSVNIGTRRGTVMKKIIILLLVLLSAVWAVRTGGDCSALFVSLVLAQVVYGKAIYKKWYKTFNT